MVAGKKSQLRAATSRPSPAPVPPSAVARLSTPLVWTSVAALLSVYMTLALLSSRSKSPTYDEPAHIAAGYTYWVTGDYRMDPESGNLPQRWLGLPLVFSNFRFPNLSGPAWEGSDVWTLGDQFLHHCGNDLGAILLRSRAAVALWGVVLGLTVFLWSRQLFGDAGGLLSLLLYAFCPTMLAHGQLATADVCTALFFLLSVWTLWHTLERVTPVRVLMSSLALGGLFLSKYSAILIFPIALVLALAHYWMHRRLILACGPRVWTLHKLPQWLAAIGAIVAVHGVAVWLLIWAAFGFRYEAETTRPQEFYKYHNLAEACERAGGAAGPIIAWFGQRHILPEAYLYGAAYTVTQNYRFSFLNGDYSLSGWAYYFPFCLAVKTPLSLFGLLAAAAIALMLERRRKVASTEDAMDHRRIWLQMFPLVVLLLVYWCTAIVNTLNIGQRHLLPTYPIMYILAGGATHWFVRSRAMSVVVGCLTATFLVESASAYPHYLAYFNVLIPRGQAYRHLVDSNLDWGQDLPGLKQWLDSKAAAVGDQTVYLRYFGTGSPDYYGIRAQRLPIGNGTEELDPMHEGIYCISATELQAVYLGGRWNASYERLYQALLDGRSENNRATGQLGMTQEQLKSLQHRFPTLQLLRLMAFLRQREPDAQIGYSILIYRLTDDDVQKATRGPPVELDDLQWLERERQRRTSG